MAVLAFLPFPVAAAIPLLVLVVTFEVIRPLHFGAERIGRYVQVFYEEEGEQGRSLRDTPSWERVAMSFGRVPGVGGHPLFVPIFFMATAVNYLGVILPGPVADRDGGDGGAASRLRRRGSSQRIAPCARNARSSSPASASCTGKANLEAPAPVLLTFDRNIPTLALVSNVDRTSCCHACVVSGAISVTVPRPTASLDEEVHAVFTSSSTRRPRRACRSSRRAERRPWNWDAKRRSRSRCARRAPAPRSTR